MRMVIQDIFVLVGFYVALYWAAYVFARGFYKGRPRQVNENNVYFHDAPKSNVGDK